MRKVVLTVALVFGAALLAGAPAQAAPGCMCGVLGKPSVCMSGVSACTATKGICWLPCDYQAPKKAAKGKKKKAA